MSHSQVYRFKNQNGLEEVIGRHNSQMSFMGFRRLTLAPGQNLGYRVEGEEQALVLQSGDFKASVEHEGRTVLEGVGGSRSSVYDDLPTALYLPPGCRVSLSSEGGMEARIFTAWCERGNAPHFCPPEQVEEGQPGAHIYKRKYRFIFGAPGKRNDHVTRRLIVGESVSVPGGWIGFPAHRHDYVTDKECVLDEIFSFQVRSPGPGGRGGLMQWSFDLDGDRALWNEANFIEGDDVAVGLPRGYHSTLALPGSTAYLLWGLAGGSDDKIYKVQFDERFTFLEDCLY